MSRVCEQSSADVQLSAGAPVNLSRVLSPISIGPVTIKNRVVRTGHGTGIGKGTMSAELVAYHVARAKGGVGLTIIEALAVGSSAYPYLVAGSPGLVEGYRDLVRQSAPYGMRIFQQIGHLGNEAPERDGSPPWSASDSIGAMLGVPAQAMTHAQIDYLINCYVEAARDCVAGGLDGIELHMAHGYLVHQFLSPLYNRRTDEYGGSFENRLRLALRLLETVRAVMPNTMALGVRLSSEGFEGGLSPDDVRQIAAVFEARRLIDFLNLSIGTDYNPHKIIGAMHEPSGYELEADAHASRGSRVPVIVSGRLRTLEEAEQVIREGHGDLVGMTRAHIADPEIVAKTAAGRAEEVRPCIGCNHGCIAGLLALGQIGCTVNVAVGLESQLSETLIQPAERQRRVLVAGGGPAGLEAARVAALRGHRVTLAEASPHLGGAVNIAALAPRRGGIADIVHWLEREVRRLGVDIRLSTYLEAEDVLEIAPDILIVATGSLPRLDGNQHLRPGLSARGMNRSSVVSSHELLTEGNNRRWGSHALVFDDTGHYEAIAAAEFLVAKGLSVTFATSHKSFAPHLAPALSDEAALERLAAHGSFHLVTYAELLNVGERTARLGQRFGGTPMDVEADTVVFVSHNEPNRELLDALESSDVEVVAVGDVRSPRYLQTAIREGHLAARVI